MVTGVVPSPPRFLPSMFIAHRVHQSHCSSIFHRVLLTHALALSASQFVHEKKSQRIYTSMHSAGLELTKLTYTRLEDNLTRHRGDRLTRIQTARCGNRKYLLHFWCQRALPVTLQKVKAPVKLSLPQLGHACFLIEYHSRHLLDALVCSPEIAHQVKFPFFRRSHSCTGPHRLHSKKNMPQSRQRSHICCQPGGLDGVVDARPSLGRPSLRLEGDALGLDTRGRFAPTTSTGFLVNITYTGICCQTK